MAMNKWLHCAEHLLVVAICIEASRAESIAGRLVLFEALMQSVV